MPNFIVDLCLIFCLYVFDSVAAPTPVSFTTRTSSPTRLQADNIGTIYVSPLPFNIRSSSRYPRDLSDASDDLQPIPNAFFPKYGIVLLILFIIICALSSALVIITGYSGTVRTWICKAPGRLYAWIASEKCKVKEVQRDHSSDRGGSTEKKRDSPLDISSGNCDSSSPYNISSELTNKTKANTSEETMTSTPAVPFSAKSIHSPPPSGNKRSPSGSAAHSPYDSAHSHPLSLPYSPLLDHLQTLLSTSKRVFQSLTSDLTSQSPTSHPPSSTIAVTVDICRPGPAEPDVSVSSSLVTRTNSDGATVTEECDLGCQDIASIPAPVVSVTISTQQSPLPHSSTHSSPSINSRSGFYSLSGDTQLSASTAFHSFIDLGMLATPTDTNPEMIPVANLSDDIGPVISLLSPRYMHGLQLETIHEESDGNISSLASASSGSVARDDSRFNMLLTSDSKMSHSTRSPACVNPPTSGHKKGPENLEESQPDLTSLTENMLSSWDEFSRETCTPPRFPAARSPPPPSEPSSAPTPQVASALRSPERQDKRRSVAWRQPVIDWAVDHPRHDCGCDLEPRSVDDLEDIPDMESDTECAAALHSADAMAAVMDSLAAIGLDPTDMGLVTGEAISSNLSNSSFHAISPSLPFVDPETFRSKLHARARTAQTDIIEEEEVENEIRTYSGYITPQKSHQQDVSSRSRSETSTENQYNRSLYQDQQQGASIKTALMSLLSPSSSHPNIGENQPSGESSDIPVNPAQDSEKERKTARRDSGREKFQIRNACIQDLNAESRKGTGRPLSPTNPRPVTRTWRAVQADRVYASPSSLAGLSPLEVAKKFSAPSVSSAGSTPSSSSGNCAASPPHHPTSVSPLQMRKIKGLSNSSSFDCTASTLDSPSRREPVSPSPRSRTPVSSRRQKGEQPALGCTKSTPMLSLSHDAGFLPQFSSSPISPMRRQNLKPAAVSALGRSAPILIERTNSMDFDSV